MGIFMVYRLVYVFFFFTKIVSVRSSCSLSGDIFVCIFPSLTKDILPLSSDMTIALASVSCDIPRAARCLNPRDLGIS